MFVVGGGAVGLSLSPSLSVAIIVRLPLTPHRTHAQIVTLCDSKLRERVRESENARKKWRETASEKEKERERNGTENKRKTECECMIVYGVHAHACWLVYVCACVLCGTVGTVYAEDK